MCFAYKNLGAIKDVTFERYAILTTMKSTATTPGELALKQNVEPTLIPPQYPGVRNFHIACDVLTIAALGAMELRRMRAARSSPNLSP